MLPGVSVERMFPATGPGSQLDAWQQEAQADGNLQLPGGRRAMPWRRESKRRDSREVNNRRRGYMILALN